MRSGGTVRFDARAHRPRVHPLTPPTLEVRNLVKTFGRNAVVRDVDMTLDEGDICGFIGPNGAGKTTTLRILATVLPRTSGDVRIAGHPLDDTDHVRPLIGYMPDVFGVYEDITVEDYLQFFARVYNIEARLQTFAVNEALALAGIETLRGQHVDTLSRGQKQRLGLARTQLHHPRLLLLDEPASGLDPEARVEFREIINHLKQLGLCVLISSHVLPDLSDMCNKLIIIHQGVVRWSGRTSELLAGSAEAARMRLRVYDDPDAAGGRAPEKARQLLLETPGVSELHWQERDLRFLLAGNERRQAEILRKLMDAEIDVVSFAAEAATLEKVYLDLLAAERG